MISTCFIFDLAEAWKLEHLAGELKVVKSGFYNLLSIKSGYLIELSLGYCSFKDNFIPKDILSFRFCTKRKSRQTVVIKQIITGKTKINLIFYNLILSCFTILHFRVFHNLILCCFTFLHFRELKLTVLSMISKKHLLFNDLLQNNPTHIFRVHFDEYGI